jgi:hypothetical protein
MKKQLLLLSLILHSFGAFAQGFQWAKSMEGTSTDVGNSIVVDAAGNVYSTGSYQGTVDFDPGPGIYNLTSAGGGDIFVIKLDDLGAFMWAISMGGTGYDGGMSIGIDAAGNVYTTGYFLGTVDFDPGANINNITAAGAYDIFVSKLDSQGVFVWAKSMGGPGDDQGLSIAVSATGNVYTTGYFYETADFNPDPGLYNLTSGNSEADAFVSKLDGSGNFLSAKQMGGSAFDAGQSITVDAAGFVYTTGVFTDIVDFDPGAGVNNLTSAGSLDVFISKLDSSGDFIWAKNFGTTSGEYSYSIAVDAAGNVYTTGYFDATGDFDPGAGVYNLSTAGSPDIFVSKLNNSGDFVWAKSMGGTGIDISFSIAVDANGNVYTTGLFSNTPDFDPGGTVYNLTSAGDNDIFISNLDSSGAFVWAKGMGGTSSDACRSIALDGCNIYTTGYFKLTADFDPDTAVYNLTSAGDYDIFISKLAGGLAPVITQNGNVLTSSPALSYQWYLDGQIIPGATSQSTTVSQSGSYSVVVDGNQCSSADLEFLITSISSSDTALCEKFCTSFSGLSAINPVSWLWIFTGGSPGTSTDQDPTGICYNDSGVYDVTIITTDTLGNSDTLVLPGYITVYQNPFPPAITQSGNIITSSPAVSYQWLLNGNAIPGATNQSYEITESGAYTLVITNENGCSAQVSIDAIFSGIENLTDDLSLSIYPNPSNGSFLIEWLSSSTFNQLKVEISNTLGQIIFSSSEKNTVPHFSKTIELNSLPPGIYILKLFAESPLLNAPPASVQKKLIIAK